MADFESSGGAFASTVGDEQDDDREPDELACNEESDRDREYCWKVTSFDRLTVFSHDSIDNGGDDSSSTVSTVVVLTKSIVNTVSSGSIFGVVYARSCSSFCSTSVSSSDSASVSVALLCLTPSSTAALYDASSSSRATNCGVTGGVRSVTRSSALSDGDTGTGGFVKGDGDINGNAGVKEQLFAAATGNVESGMRMA